MYLNIFSLQYIKCVKVDSLSYIDYFSTLKNSLPALVIVHNKLIIEILQRFVEIISGGT